MSQDSEFLIWHELGAVLLDYDLRFAERRAVASAAATGAPALAHPSRIGECRRCPWWPVCSVELAEARDVSLVAVGTDVVVLRAAGIGTIERLAGAPAAVVAALPLTGIEPMMARVRARAWLADLPLVRRVVEVSVPRADVELDVDMESYLDDGAYLWGTWLSGPAVEEVGVSAGYRPFVTWRPLPDPDEGRAFVEFWQFLQDLRRTCAERGWSFRAYCYSRTAEERWLLSTPVRCADEPGMPSVAEVVAFCAGPEWVDLFEQIRQQFLVPGSLKLKVLARLSGFSWRDPDPGGANSMAWYDRAVGRSGGRPERASAERILAYNEDDVLATLSLRGWINDHGLDFPTIEQVAADDWSGPARPLGASPGVSAR